VRILADVLMRRQVMQAMQSPVHIPVGTSDAAPDQRLRRCAKIEEKQVLFALFR
jgi:hypothetical protein